MSTFKELINAETPLLVYFSAEWSAPCKMMPPILKEVTSKVGDKAKIMKVDIDKNPTAAAAYHVKSVPTLIIFKKGDVKWRQIGLMQTDKLIKKLLSYA